MFKCSFCNNEYTTKSSLNRHQKTVKKCLSNNEKIEEYKCNNCDYITTLKSNLTKHEKNCKLKNIKKIYDENTSKIKEDLLHIENTHKEDIINIRNKYEEELKILKEKLDKSEEENERLVSDNFNLERKIEKHEEKLYNMASRPTTVNTVNTTNNNTNLLIVDFNKSTIKDSVENNFTLEHLNEGIKGVAKFTKDYIVKPEEGKRKYICSDPSRCVFKYRDENGVVQKDVRAVKLKNVIKDPIITKSKTLFIEENSRLFEDMANGEDMESESMTFLNEKITVLKDNFLRVKNMDENSNDYAREMALVLNE